MKILSIIKNKLVARDVCALLTGIVGLIIFILMWYGNADIVRNITHEDALIENLSAIFWLEASIICFYRIATSSQRNKLLLYFWGILSFICFCEEISWGQRIFGYSIEVIQNINMQNEVSIHNLAILNHLFRVSDFLRSGEWSNLNIDFFALFNIYRMFLIGFFVYFMIIPLAMRSKMKYLQEKFYYDPPSYIFMVSIWPIIILFCTAGVISRSHALVEGGEMYIAFVVLLYVIFYLYVNPENDSVDRAAPTKPIE